MRGRHQPNAEERELTETDAQSSNFPNFDVVGDGSSFDDVPYLDQHETRRPKSSAKSGGSASILSFGVRHLEGWVVLVGEAGLSRSGSRAYLQAEKRKKH